MYYWKIRFDTVQKVLNWKILGFVKKTPSLARLYSLQWNSFWYRLIFFTSKVLHRISWIEFLPSRIKCYKTCVFRLFANYPLKELRPSQIASLKSLNTTCFLPSLKIGQNRAIYTCLEVPYGCIYQYMLVVFGASTCNYSHVYTIQRLIFSSKQA